MSVSPSPRKDAVAGTGAGRLGIAAPLNCCRITPLKPGSFLSCSYSNFIQSPLLLVWGLTTEKGALTFFPPDPPLYKFQRVDKDGKQLPDIDDDDVNDSDGEDEDEYDSDSDSELGVAADAPPNKATTRTSKEKREEREQRRRDEANADPIVAMTERSKIQRKRSIVKHRIDAADAKAGVTYRFVPDTDSLGSLPSFNGSVEAVKIGPQKKTGTYIAALLYRRHAEDVDTKTIVYSHGNATDVGAMAGLQCLLAKNVNCHVLVYDYSGYGESGGMLGEKKTYRDIELVFQWTIDNVAKHERNIVLYGQSVGSGPSCYLASRKPELGGLILHSPFTSGLRVLTPSRVLGCLDIFPNIDRIKKAHCKVFIIHGQKDNEVPIEHGLSLQAAVRDDCKTDPWWVPDKGHNDIVDGPNIIQVGSFAFSRLSKSPFLTLAHGLSTQYINRLNQFMRLLKDEDES